MTAAWYVQLRANPFGTMAAGAAMLLGTLGAVLGDDVSQGMTNSLSHSANIVAHIWGVAFAFGGVLKLFGLYRHRSEIEIPGLWLMIGGYAFYSLTVIAGLGMGGLAAGIISTAFCFGCVLKTHMIMVEVRLLRQGR